MSSSSCSVPSGGSDLFTRTVTFADPVVETVSDISSLEAWLDSQREEVHLAPFEEELADIEFIRTYKDGVFSLSANTHKLMHDQS
jgi:hypothetical protein